MKPPAATTTYRDTGVLGNEELGLGALLRWIGPTEENRSGRIGRSALEVGYFANVIDLGGGQGLALTCDGVGTKILVAELLGRYDTIGIDCVAMNVNDVICVGAEPVSMLDYIAVERATPEVLEAIGRGLHEGAGQAGINIVGGEIAQLREIIRGAGEGPGIDLVGMCVGVVPLDRINTGKSVVPGDLIVGFESSGIHSNGLTLARRVLLGENGPGPEAPGPGTRASVAEELLRPTRIYAALVRDLQARKLPLKALAHITSDGFLNLARIDAPVGFRIERLPPTPPIFRLVQERGSVPETEMFRVFNMGIGFCVIVPPAADVLKAVQEAAARHGYQALELGTTVADPEKKVLIPEKRLIGKDGAFHEEAA